MRTLRDLLENLFGCTSPAVWVHFPLNRLYFSWPELVVIELAIEVE